MSFKTLLKEYMARGWSVVPIPFKGKGPIIEKWQNLKINDKNVDKYFNGKDQNVGVILGKSSGNLGDMDLDCIEAVTLAPLLLPKTEKVFGRKSKPLSHYLYTVSDPDPKGAIRLQDENDNTIIELRLGGGKGAQTVFPGSVHPSGELIEWSSDGELGTYSCAELKRAAVRIAVATILIRNWPQKSRHDAALRCGGFLARVGWSAVEISEFIGIVQRESGVTNQDHIENGCKAAHDAAETFYRDGSGYGLPALGEFFGEKQAARIGKFLEYRDAQNDDVLEKLNERFCILPVAGKMRVLEFTEVRGRRMATFYAVADFKIMLDNITVKCGINSKGEETYMGQGSWWLSRKNRRQYAGLVFKPGFPNVVDGCLNLWRGWGIEPRAGNWELLRKHIFAVLANGNKKFDEYIIKWTAWTLQNPGEPAGVVLVFRGGRGAGKGLFGRELKKAFGQHGLHISSASHLSGRFNAHLMDCALLFADEAFWPGDKSSEGSLKRMITEDVLFIERKGVDGFEVDNNLHIVMASNSDWIVPAGFKERRFAVFDVSENHTQQKDYFKPLYDEIAAGGTAAMMHDLLAMDLGDWHPRDSIPQNKALADQQDQSLSALDQWWVGLLQAGELPGATPDRPRLAPSRFLFEQARETAPGLRFTSDHLLARYLKLRGCSRDVNHRIAGQRAWEFPPLTEARGAWSKAVKTVWESPYLADWKAVL